MHTKEINCQMVGRLTLKWKAEEKRKHFIDNFGDRKRPIKVIPINRFQSMPNSEILIAIIWLLINYLMKNLSNLIILIH